MKPAIRMKEIAVTAGVSVATVSRALQNHPAIPVETRQRIQALAHRMGYRPNPMLGVLMTQIRGRKQSSGSNLACVHGEPPGGDFFRAQEEFLAGVRAAAPHLGYHVNFFDLAKSKLNEDQLVRIWKARGVRGVILSHIRAPAPLQFPWEDYAWVVNSTITGLPDFHRVGNGIYEIVKRAVHEVKRRGYRRPALVARLRDETRVGFRWPAAFLGNVLRYGLEASMDRVFQGEWTIGAFRKWFEGQRPDVVFALVDQPKQWMEEMNIEIPEETGFVHLAANISNEKVSGVTQDFRRVGEAAVHALDSELRRNETGIPAAPVSFTVAGSWQEGGTLRNR